jgi:hypothetical protein
MGLQRRVLIHCSAYFGILVHDNVRYNTANMIKKRQDQYCSQALAGQWKNIGKFPEDLQWEALVDVLRGRVKVIECVLD